MKTAMLNKIIDDGEKITLMDGSVWSINPGDTPTVCTWIPTAEIEISESNDSVFDHILTNKNIGVSVNAMKLS